MKLKAIYNYNKELLTIKAVPLSVAQVYPHMPYQMIGDIAFIYYYEGALVSNEIMKKLWQSNDSLWRDALEIAPIMHPASLRNMNDVMKDMLGDAADMLMPDEPSPMWVATIEGGQDGACVIQYPGFLEQAAEVLGGDFFILPSSIHEVLFLKDDGSLELSDLEELVRNTNETEVAPKDRLSNSVFYYDSEAHVLEKLSK